MCLECPLGYSSAAMPSVYPFVSLPHYRDARLKSKHAALIEIVSALSVCMESACFDGKSV